MQNLDIIHGRRRNAQREGFVSRVPPIVAASTTRVVMPSARGHARKKSLCVHVQRKLG